jgi:hypothetical protein
MDSMNLYGYGWGSPVGVIDPLGLYIPPIVGWVYNYFFGQPAGQNLPPAPVPAGATPNGANAATARAREADAANRGDYFAQAEALGRMRRGAGSEVMGNPATALKAGLFMLYIVPGTVVGGVGGVEDLIAAGVAVGVLKGAKALKRYADGKWVKVAEDGTETAIDAKNAEKLEGLHKEGKIGNTVEGGCDAKKGAQEGTAGSLGRYQDKGKHHENSPSGIGKAPSDGQRALNRSVQVKDTSPRRVAYDKESGEFVVLDKDGEGSWHGHVREWDEMPQDMKNALIDAGVVDRKGRPL